MKILSIDDSRSVHAFIDRALASSSYQTIHAMSGREGLEILKKEGAVIKVVLLDWEMPEMNGPEVLKLIRNQGFKLPVIMITSKNDPKLMVEIINAGATEFIMKPFTPDILLQKLESISTH